MDKKKRGGQELSSQQKFLFIFGLLAFVGSGWFITFLIDALRDGMWAAVLLAFAVTNIVYIAVRERQDGTLLETATAWRRMAVLGIFVASFVLILWILPVAVEFSTAKP